MMCPSAVRSPALPERDADVRKTGLLAGVKYLDRRLYSDEVPGIRGAGRTGCAVRLNPRRAKRKVRWPVKSTGMGECGERARSLGWMGLSDDRPLRWERHAAGAMVSRMEEGQERRRLDSTRETCAGGGGNVLTRSYCNPAGYLDEKKRAALLQLGPDGVGVLLPAEAEGGRSEGPGLAFGSAKKDCSRGVGDE